MDACDELGLFVIVNTPGWQFWNDDPIFGQRVYDDIRNMVRRDRNHASVWLWEPILNETWYPEDFARNVADILKEEYPYPYCYAGCDATARGKEYFPVHFTHPAIGGGGAFNAENLNPQISYFTREWGDNVDNWNSHNLRAGQVELGVSTRCLYRLRGMPSLIIGILVMTYCTGLPDSIWVGVCGIRSTISAGIILILFMAGLWMLSVNRSCLIICFVPNVRQR